MTRYYGFLILLLATVCTYLPAQETDKREFARAVQEADLSFYYDEDYEKAASLYEPLLKSNPGNENLAAKLGICYLNLEGKKKEALSLLRTASTNFASGTRDYSESGEKAPADVMMYLALAYQMNDSLEKAVSIYKALKQDVGKSEVFREDYLDKQINSCMYAIEMKKKPLTILREYFTPWLEKYAGACNPVISENDSVFVFTQKTGGKTRIFCSYKKDTWDLPVEITPQLGGYDRLYTNSITGDGKLLVLFIDDGGDGNLYFSERKGTQWSRIKAAGKNINSIYWESFGYITPDGKQLYFSSNRNGGQGELDIWLSARNPDGSWNQPVNLGKTINTPYNEDTPFFDQVSGELVFSSSGHLGMGGYDVFRSVFENNIWTNPSGLPFAFNTTTDNTFFVPKGKSHGFITTLFDDKNNSSGIFEVVSSDPAEELTVAEGSIILGDGIKTDPEKASVSLINLNKPSSPAAIPVSADGKFRLEARPGDYQVNVTYPDYESTTVKLNIPLFYLSHYMHLDVTLVPEKIADGRFLAVNNILFSFNSYELNEESIRALEEIKSVLIDNPELKIKLAGYTDALGSQDYNLQLAGKRAKAIVDYLTSQSIPASRFVSTAYGATDFIALNTNDDGSDNPEGRKYNRRVEFGIVDPQTGVTISHDTYTPEHFRIPSSMKYSVVLIKSPKRLSKDYFSKLSLGGKLAIRSIESDTLSVYAVGVFLNRPDAVTYLGHAREMGFKDANVINQYDLNEEAKSLSKRNIIVSLATGKRIYTIQLIEAKSPVSMDMFREITGVREISGDDGYYRYLYGEYENQAHAQEALKGILEKGFGEALIRELNSLIVN